MNLPARSTRNTILVVFLCRNEIQEMNWEVHFCTRMQSLLHSLYFSHLLQAVGNYPVK